MDLIIMADGIAILWDDVIALFCLNLNFGRCYTNMTMDCHQVVLMADVICHNIFSIVGREDHKHRQIPSASYMG